MTKILYGLLAVILSALPANAANEQHVKLLHDTVLEKFPDLQSYCQLPDAERRQLVVKTVMKLAEAKLVSEPFEVGTAAGDVLRRACGRDVQTAQEKTDVRWTVSAKPLGFSGERNLAGPADIRSLGNRIYTPAGPGPFPAVVIIHSKGISQHLMVHTKELLEAGFAVLVVDSFGPRDIRLGGELFPGEFVKDAYDALAHLMSQPYIDSTRIFQTGYSYGGLAAAMLANPDGARALKAPGRFRATVANYGCCSLDQPGATSRNDAKFEILGANSDRPILMLMAELDVETPPSTCFPLLDDMKAAGKDVEWHIYPKTTHAWDKLENHGFLYRASNGQTMTYTYDPVIAKDATDRMIAFFNRYR